MCGLASTRSPVAGSSSSACTASQWTCHAATGSWSTEGPWASSMPAPAERNAASHPVRCLTTSRATQPATGAGASQCRVPRTRSVNRPPMRRCRSAGRSDSAIGEHPVKLRVPIVDTGLHAAGQPCIAAFEAVDQRLGTQPRVAVAQVLEPQRLQRDAVGLALERERLHDAVRAYVMEAAAEGVLPATTCSGVPPAATRTYVPVVDPGVHAVGTGPPGEQ